MASEQLSDVCLISDPEGGNDYVLARCESDARAWAQSNWGDDFETLEYVGWMAKVFYPDGYESREEWEQSHDFNPEWWERCAAPINDKQREHARQAWLVRYR